MTAAPNIVAPALDRPAAGIVDQDRVLAPVVAVLFCRADSVYKTLPGTDVWDAERDARNWPGGTACVAHPPCRAWGQMAQFSKPRADEMDLARFAVRMVRENGGVLEHPAGSRLWADQNLPAPGPRDSFGGFTLALPQLWFGHRAEKLTRLYIVGTGPGELPEVPFTLAGPTHYIRRPKCPLYRPGMPRYKPELTHAAREHTPPAFAQWLLSVARRCGKNSANSPTRLACVKTANAAELSRSPFPQCA